MRDKTLSTRIRVEIEIPTVPNFIKAGGVHFPLEHFDEATLNDVAVLWTQKLLENARHRRAMAQAEKQGESA